MSTRDILFDLPPVRMTANKMREHGLIVTCDNGVLAEVRGGGGILLPPTTATVNRCLFPQHAFQPIPSVNDRWPQPGVKKAYLFKGVLHSAELAASAGRD